MDLKTILPKTMSNSTTHGAAANNCYVFHLESIASNIGGFIKSIEDFYCPDLLLLRILT